MTTEKFTETAETLKKNVTNTMKWLQDTTSTIIETQSKQMKSASEMYSKVMTATLEGITKDNFSTSFQWSETMVEVLKKNIEAISEMSKTTMKTATEFGKQTSTETFSKETMTKIIDTYKKQVEEITTFNKKSFETITKQFDLTNTTTPFTTYAEKFKKEFEANVETSKEKVQTIVDSYKKIATPSTEANKELFNKLNTEINTSVNSNLKIWSDLLNTYSAKGFETPNMTEFFKTASNGGSTTKKTPTTVKI
jgi:hypothetical protein